MKEFKVKSMRGMLVRNELMSDGFDLLDVKITQKDNQHALYFVL